MQSYISSVLLDEELRAFLAFKCEKCSRKLQLQRIGIVNILVADNTFVIYPASPSSEASQMKLAEFGGNCKYNSQEIAF